MRTEQSLGYLVWSFPTEERGIHFYKFVIQSNVQDPNYISQKTTEFINEKYIELLELTQEEFKKIKDGFFNEIRKPVTSIYGRIQMHFAQI